ncbi:kinesin-like protein KIN-14R [Magnolia sinica]|uniref:kinesin-like protein KIN-14R n=1 Tax=Magnolia sinica TaxID=86752 RepID=UPI00265976A9|nr:kinesin-like protein KIN-14R [Magnolia sinica]
MEETSHHDPNTQIPDSLVRDWEKDSQNITSSSVEDDLFSYIRGKDFSAGVDDDEDRGSVDSVLCISGSRLVQTGFKQANCTDDIVMLVNSGGGTITGLDSKVNLKSDFCFQGGDVIRTNENIVNGGDCPSLYQSARYGNFCYQFEDLAPGDYFVDLHFAEIVNTNGPKGMRVFNVFMQQEKVLSEFDIYSVVGANQPFQLVDARVHVEENRAMAIRFEGIHGSPIVCGICIRKAPKTSDSSVKSKYLVCNNCSTKIDVPTTQDRARAAKSISKYEKKIQELTHQCQLKTDECYEAWMSLTAANDQLDKLRMELSNHFLHSESLDRALEKQSVQLRDVSNQYERGKKVWFAAINDLKDKMKVMKREHAQLSQEAHDCADSVPELNKMVFAVQSLVAQCEELKVKYNEELAKRRKLYNQVLETKGNIRVFCRCRPLSKEEVSSGCALAVDFDAAKDGDLGVLTGGGSTKKIFKFDRVYTPKDNQADVFADAAPLVISVLDGYNVCIFAYGQTGTGKTFTMEGTEKNRGVNYRTVEELFKIAKERRETFAYSISVSVLEVYNEQIRDLLATSPSSKKLEIRQAAEGAHHVPGIVEAKVENIKQVWDVLQVGSSARAVGSNNVNEHSSRSHCMLCIMVKAKNLMNGECTKSKLWLVDLAGSERLAKTDVQGERLKEAQNINRSLSALGDVVSALATKSSHIPYRNSKLTHLLQDSLGGDSKTLMFVQISPSEHDSSETLSSLNFATRVRGIELNPAKKQIDSSELQKTKQMLEKARQESRYKDESIRKLEERNLNLENKLRSEDQFIRNQQEKIKDLEGQIELKMDLQSQSERQFGQVSEKLKRKEEMCFSLQHKVKELENRMKEQQHSESIILQQKVKEVENKLKEQQHSESIILQQKITDLENKLKEQYQHQSMLLPHPTLQSTPIDRRSVPHIESINGTDLLVLRSSDSINRPMSQPSALLRGADSLHEIKRRRERRSGSSLGDYENNNTNIIVPPPPLLDKKPFPTELSRPSLDPAKAFKRLTKTSKPVTTSNAQKLFPHSRVGAVKETLKWK